MRLNKFISLAVLLFASLVSAEESGWLQFDGIETISDTKVYLKLKSEKPIPLPGCYENKYVALVGENLVSAEDSIVNSIINSEELKVTYTLDSSASGKDKCQLESISVVEGV